MRTIIRTALAGFFLVSTVAVAQVENDADGFYDSTTRVDTNNNSTSTSTVNTTSDNTNTNNNVNTTTVDSTNTNTNINTSTSVNTNNNINSGEQTFNNNNVNTTTSTNTNNNNNVNTSTSTSTNTNNNNNVNTSTSTNTNNNNNVNSSTSTNTNINRNENNGTMTNNNNNKVEQTVKSPPPSAIAPAMMSGGNSDLCTTGTSGSVQTQIMGVASGSTVRDMNCERLKNAKVLYDMGMKVAAVATLCQDRRVFDAMWNAGTPCPYEGQIGAQAKASWEANQDKIPAYEKEEGDDFYKKASFGAVLGWLLFIL
jgi:hypothetical protein